MKSIIRFGLACLFTATLAGPALAAMSNGEGQAVFLIGWACVGFASFVFLLATLIVAILTFTGHLWPSDEQRPTGRE